MHALHAQDRGWSGRMERANGDRRNDGKYGRMDENPPTDERRRGRIPKRVEWNLKFEKDPNERKGYHV